MSILIDHVEVTPTIPAGTAINGEGSLDGGIAPKPPSYDSIPDMTQNTPNEPKETKKAKEPKAPKEPKEKDTANLPTTTQEASGSKPAKSAKVKAPKAPKPPKVPEKTFPEKLGSDLADGLVKDPRSFGDSLNLVDRVSFFKLPQAAPIEAVEDEEDESPDSSS